MHIGFVSDYHLVTKEYLFHLIKYSDSRTSSSTELHTAGAFYLKQLQVIAHFFFLQHCSSPEVYGIIQPVQAIWVELTTVTASDVPTEGQLIRKKKNTKYCEQRSPQTSEKHKFATFLMQNRSCTIPCTSVTAGLIPNEDVFCVSATNTQVTEQLILLY